MKQNGIYTAFVAILALFLLSSGIFNAKIEIESAGKGLNSNAIINMQSNWQNARYLMDKTTSDAIYDKMAGKIIRTKNCVLPAFDSTELAEYGNVIAQYMRTIRDEIEKYKNANCEVSTITPAYNSGKLEMEFSTECTATSPKMTVSFSDKVALSKTPTVSENAGTCEIVIYDNQSQLNDIDRTIIIS